jgi:hypothetical protein
MKGTEDDDLSVTEIWCCVDWEIVTNVLDGLVAFIVRVCSAK